MRLSIIPVYIKTISKFILGDEQVQFFKIGLTLYQMKFFGYSCAFCVIVLWTIKLVNAIFWSCFEQENIGSEVSSGVAKLI